MKYRTLGRTGLQVSEIGYGCMSLREDNTGNAQLLQKAYAAGINYFDTADIYQHGNNERLLGKALHAYRHQIILATKVGNRYQADGKTLDWIPSKKYILSSVEGSLQRLQTDYIDLYQLHGGTTEDPVDEIIEAFETLQQQGKIRHYGLSSIRPNVIRNYTERAGIVSVMMQYSLLDRRAEETCFPLLGPANISVLVRGAVAQGLLAGKPAADYLDHTAATVARMAQAIHAIAPGDPATAAIAFALLPAPVASVIVGIRDEHQLKSALDAPTINVTQEAELLRLAQSTPLLFYTQHR